MIIEHNMNMNIGMNHIWFVFINFFILLGTGTEQINLYWHFLNMLSVAAASSGHFWFMRFLELLHNLQAEIKSEHKGTFMNATLNFKNKEPNYIVSKCYTLHTPAMNTYYTTLVDRQEANERQNKPPLCNKVYYICPNICTAHFSWRVVLSQI